MIVFDNMTMINIINLIIDFNISLYGSKFLCFNNRSFENTEEYYYEIR